MGNRGDRWHRRAEAHSLRDGLVMAAVLVICWSAFVAAGCAACFGTAW